MAYPTIDSPVCEDAVSAVQAMLELLPFPAVLFEPLSGAVVVANQAARRYLDRPTAMTAEATGSTRLRAQPTLVSSPWRVLGHPFLYDGKTVRVSVLNPSLDLRDSDGESIPLNDSMFWEMFWYSTRGMFQSSREGRFLRVNPAFARTLKYDSPDDMIQSVRNMETDFYRDSHLRERYQDRLEISESIQGIEFEALCKDKQTIWLSVQSRAVRGLSGKILYYEGTVDDISERKRVEEQLSATQQRIVNQSAQLAYHVKELEQFSDILAHDLSAPLRMIGMYLPLIESRCADVLSTKDKEFFKFVVDGAAHMKNLMSGLLRYAKTRVPPKPVHAVSSETCLILARENLKEQIESSQTELTWVALPEVFIDPAMLTGVFQNLIGNALKYADVSPILIHVSACLDGEYWVFRFADNGKGISVQDQKRIFFLYQRGEETSQKEGSGIGLASCQKIIIAYGGRMWVESEPGKPTSFYFSIPIQREV